MKKKIISLILALSIVTSMTTAAFAATNDRPKACASVLLIEEINIK